MKVSRILVALLGLLAAGAWAASPRSVIPFNSDWHFTKGDVSQLEAPASTDGSWEDVTLPHTWNAIDAVPGHHFYVGVGWYQKTFAAPDSWNGKRVFLRFEAASLVADVWLNGVKLGEHRGGFTAFCYEIGSTLHWNGENTVVVKVDNSRGTVSPLAGDFTVFGGLYRPAELIVTNQLAITPLDFAGPGVYLKPTSITPERATVEVTAKVACGTARPQTAIAAVTVFDARNRVVASGRSDEATIYGGATLALTKEIEIPSPHLWNGIADPYLYHVRVDIVDHNGRTVDSVEQPLGLRTYHVDPERGWILNGKAMQIRGVCLHQDEGAHGWAATHHDQEVDFSFLKELGVTGVRMAHYPHNDYSYTLADKAGIMVWAELSLVNNVRGTPEFLANLRQQLTELITQEYNHPSIVMWSMYNEIGSNNKGINAPGPIIKMLSDLAHKLDPTRLTTGAASGDTMARLPDVMRAVDLVSLNFYPGWYGGKISDLGPDIDRYNKRYGSKGVGVSEYGAGASIHDHEQGMTKGPKTTGHFHPEEWQAIVHEGDYAQIAARPYVWGSFLWVTFDFASVSRHEGDTDGINDKGLVTRDRKTRKDAFYFYKANWTSAPMVYITSRRDANRTDPHTEIKVYSNCSTVTLRVNGVDFGPMPSSGMHVFVVPDVLLKSGSNRIEVAGSEGGREVRDGCRWVLRR